jgi:hypothetical protein
MINGKQWLLILVLLGFIFFVCMWALGVLASDFFFQGWGGKAFLIDENTILFILENPDMAGDPPKVKVLAKVIDEKLAVINYCYFDKTGKAHSYRTIGGGKYGFDSEHIKTCVRCHKSVDAKI